MSFRFKIMNYVLQTMNSVLNVAESEQNHDLIRADALALVAKGMLEGAYPALVEAGTWQKVSLFKKKHCYSIYMPAIDRSR